MARKAGYYTPLRDAQTKCRKSSAHPDPSGSVNP